MATTLKTPGVYIVEKNAFPSSVAAVPTAVPAFIGYTQKTIKNGQSLVNKPVRINSLSEYVEIFGEGFSATFEVKGYEEEDFDFKIGEKGFKVTPATESRFILYDSLRLFFSNGGGTCYIVTVGAFYKAPEKAKPSPTPSPSLSASTGNTPGSSGSGTNSPSASSSASSAPKLNSITKSALEKGMNALITEDEPTMVVIPEAIMLEKNDCNALQQDMLKHCGYIMKDRVAILDVYDGHLPRTYDKDDVITQFREGVGNNFLSFGQAYYPWVYTSVVQNEEINTKNFAEAGQVEKILLLEAESIENPKRKEESIIEVKKLSDKKHNVESLTQTLKVISPTFKIILDRIRTHMNILPPSAGMAGVFTAVDNTIGVWKAPANVGFNNVITPTIKLTNDDQEDLNVTVTGKSVNAIRTFVGEGTVVWGARTLDGNSQDWRYINVRRTMLFIQQSVKFAAKTYVFSPNTNGTWILVKSMISSFLNNIWQQGGLVGASPAEAYDVQVGLGTTMTPNDILDGVMKIMVKVAISRPAEFIVITFQQKMQES